MAQNYIFFAISFIFIAIYRVQQILCVNKAMRWLFASFYPDHPNVRQNALCPECERQEGDEPRYCLSSLRSHLKKQHPRPAGEKIFQCKDCTAILTSKTYFGHLKMHARSGKIACPYLNCNIVIMTSQGRCTDNLLKHKRNYHEDQEVFQVVEPNQLRVHAFVEDQTDDHLDRKSVV